MGEKRKFKVKVLAENIGPGHRSTLLKPHWLYDLVYSSVIVTVKQNLERLFFRFGTVTLQASQYGQDADSMRKRSALSRVDAS